MKELNFSEESLLKQWKYVNRNIKDMGLKDPFAIVEKDAHRIIRNLMEEMLQEEFDVQVGARCYERTGSRIGRRKGYYTRLFTTTFGTTDLKIPRARKQEIRFGLFEKYQRRHERFDYAVLMSMLLGFSTRKQRRFFQSFLGDSVSHQTAARFMESLDESVQAYRTQAIEDKYKYLQIDGLWVKVKEEEVKSRPIIFVLGITHANKKEVLSFRLCRGETEVEIRGILYDLYRRGLKGESLRVITSDGARGIRSAIETIYPHARWQLCYVHKMRNVYKKMKKKVKHRKELMGDVSTIYKADSRQEAIERYNAVQAKWRKKERLSMHCLKSNINDTLTFYEYKEDRNQISSTNYIERMHEEIRRRIKIQGYFKSVKSLNLWIYALLKINTLLPDMVSQLDCTQESLESAQFA